MSSYRKRVSNSFRSEADHSLYVLHEGGKVVWLVIYVDDMLAASNCHAYFDDFKTRLRKRFDLTDLGPARHFLGMHITRDRETRKCLLTVNHILP